MAHAACRTCPACIDSEMRRGLVVGEDSSTGAQCFTVLRVCHLGSYGWRRSAMSDTKQAKEAGSHHSSRSFSCKPHGIATCVLAALGASCPSARGYSASFMTIAWCATKGTFVCLFVQETRSIKMLRLDGGTARVRTHCSESGLPLI